MATATLSTTTKTVYGFITVVQVPKLGHCGGLLLLNSLGRPIEFHCTAPVVENRAQRILYGETFEGFLFCDQIGLALAEKLKNRPSILLTDRTELLALNELVESPVVLVESLESDSKYVDSLRTTSDAQQVSVAPSDTESFDQTFAIDDQAFRSQSLSPQLLTNAKRMCEEFAQRLPLDEPFERIRGAIEEAQAIAR